MLHTEINGPFMYLHDMIEGKGKSHKVKVIGVSSYAGCATTFLVLTDSGALYADVPGHLLSEHPHVSNVTLDQVTYCNNPSTDCWVGVLPSLLTAQVFGRDRNYLGQGHYIATMDWHNANWMAHIILMKTGALEGRLIVWPQHCVLWNTVRKTLPEGYKRVKESWRITYGSD